MRLRRPPQREAIAISDRESFALRDSRGSHWAFVWHHHPEIELTLILSGHGMRFVGASAEPFGPGDLCLLGSGLPHSWTSKNSPGTQVRSLVAQFLPAVIAPMMTLPEGRRIAAMLARAPGGLVAEGAQRTPITERFAALIALPPGVRRITGLIEVLDDLAALPLRPLSTGTVPAPAPRQARRLERVMTAVNARLGEAFSQREAAASAGLTPPAFCRFFRRAFGRSFVAHRNERRIALACRELLESDDRVLDIATRCGFANLSNFNRRFRLLQGVSPREYRIAARAANEETIERR